MRSQKSACSFAHMKTTTTCLMSHKHMLINIGVMRCTPPDAHNDCDPFWSHCQPSFDGCNAPDTMTKHIGNHECCVQRLINSHRSGGEGGCLNTHPCSSAASALPPLFKLSLIFINFFDCSQRPQTNRPEKQHTLNKARNCGSQWQRWGMMGACPA